MTNLKISALSSATSVADTDILPIVATPGATPTNKKVTKSVFLGGNYATIANVDDYGAVGNGSTDDTAAIILAVASGKDIAFTHGKTYIVSNEVQFQTGQAVYGNSAVIKRKAQVTTTTTTSVTTNVTTSITVASTTGFVVGMNIALAQGATFDASYHTITSIVGSVITVGSAFRCTVSGTTTVFQTFYTFKGSTGGGNRFYNITFDGNKSNWSIARWSVTVEIYFLNNNCIARDCYIHDGPAEGIIVSGDYCTIDNCTIINMNGNGVHFSGANHPVVDKCWVQNCNLDTSVGHADGCIIWSSTIADATVTNCYMDTAISGLGGIDDTDNSDCTLTGNTIRNMTTVGIDMICGSSTSSAVARCVISNNRVYNSVVGIRISQTQSSPTVFPTNFTITGNYFEGNSTIELKLIGTRQLTATGNIFVHSGKTNYNLQMDDVKDIIMEGNEFIGGDYGCYIQSSNTLTQNVKITGNIFKDQIYNAVTTATDGMTGVTIEANTITNTSASDASYHAIDMSTLTVSRGNTINILKGTAGINAFTNDASAFSNHVTVPVATTSLLAGSTSTGNCFAFNCVNTAPSVAGGAALGNTDHMNINFTKLDGTLMVVSEGGGSSRAVMRTQGPTTTIDLDINPKGAGAINIRKRLVNSFIGLPTITAGAGSGTSPTVTVTAASTDMAGTISIVAGTVPSAGLLATLNLINTYSHPPRLLLSPTNANAAALQAYAVGDKTNPTISCVGLPIAAQTYTWDYFMIQDVSG